MLSILLNYLLRQVKALDHNFKITRNLKWWYMFYPGMAKGGIPETP